MTFDIYLEDLRLETRERIFDAVRSKLLRDHPEYRDMSDDEVKESAWDWLNRRNRKQTLRF